LNVNVQGASFATSPNSGNTIPVRQMISFDHLTATITGNLTLDTTVKTLTGMMLVVVVNSTSGQMIFSKTFSVLMSFGSNPSFKFVLLIPIAPFALGAICTVSSSVDQATFSSLEIRIWEMPEWLTLLMSEWSSATTARFWALQATILQLTSML